MSPSEIAGWWGAIIATLLLIWDVYKWKTSGPKLLMRATPNIIISPGPNNTLYVNVTISNIGHLPTTLNNIGIKYYENLYAQIRRKPSISGFVPNPKTSFPLPIKLDTGGEWSALLLQQEKVGDKPSLEELAKSGHLMIWVKCSHLKHGKNVRLTIKDKKEHPEV